MKRGRRWIVLAGAGVAALALATWFVWQRPLRREFLSDGRAIRQPRDEARPRDILWEPARALAELLNTTDDDYEPRLSWDGTTLYFVRGKAGGHGDLYCTRRTPTGWTDPEPLAALDSEYDELGPEPAPDGRALYFYSDRPGGLGGYDLWVADRSDDGWDAPRNLGPAVNSAFNDYGPAISPDGERLYFASNRPQEADPRQPDPHAWPATVREDLFRRTYDLYVATLGSRGPRDVRPLAELNTPANEGSPCVSPAGDFLYFASDRAGGAGGFDLYRARRVATSLTPAESSAPAWRPAENLGSPLNTPANELDPGLGALGFALFFSSDRPGQRSAPFAQPAGERAPDPTASPTRESAHTPDYNLYYCTAREVYVDSELRPRPRVDWMTLWRAIGPNLLWLILALLLLALLWTLWGDIRNRRLALLTRCLLASLMAHLLLMLLFNFWKVTAGLVDFVRRGGAIQVSLEGAVLANSIDSQIRASAASMVLPAAEAAPAVTAPLELSVARNETFELPAPAMPNDSLRPVDSNVPTNEAELRLAADPPQVTAPAIDALALELPVPRAAEAASDAIEAALTLPKSAQPAPPIAEVRSDFVLAADETIVELSAASAADAAASHAEDHASIVTRMGLRESATSQAAVRFPAPSAAGPAPAEAVLAVRLPAEPPPRASSEAADDSATDRLPPAAVQCEAGRPRPVAPSEPIAPVELGSLELASRSSRDRDGSASPALSASAAREAAPPAAEPSGVPAAELAAGAPLPTLALRLPQAPAPADPEATLGAARGEDVGLRPVGTLFGRVLDSITQAPIGSARLRLDLPESESLTVQTDESGRYRIDVPEMPEFFALSASHEQYAPAAASIPSERLRRGRLRQDFRLDPRSGDVISIESAPRVHHLGNDLWEGSINSQFQTTAEGRQFDATFLVPDERFAELPSGPGAIAVVTYLAKGVQCSHAVRINGRALGARLDSSPDDGSYGVYALPFDAAWLRAGENSVRIRAVSCMGDLDDFEFINVQIHLPTGSVERPSESE